MTAATTQSDLELRGTPFALHRFSTDDYLHMIDTGVLGPSDKVELIDGMIVAMSPSGPGHHNVQTRLVDLFDGVRKQALRSVQGTLVIADGEVYDPDFMLLRRKPEGYKKSLPRPADVLLLIETSDTTLRKDRHVKLPVYAAAGIAEYWIADVERELLIVHRDPSADSYRSVAELKSGDSVAPRAFPDHAIAVADIFA
jgi:Uma2 family endonuclease